MDDNGDQTQIFNTTPVSATGLYRYDSLSG
jgi:hypothetical protein